MNRSGDVKFSYFLFWMLAATLLVSAAKPMTSHAANLTLTGTFSTANIGGFDGIAFDPASGNLFAVDRDRDLDTDPNLFEITTSGALINSITLAGAVDYEGIDVLPNGNLLLEEDDTDFAEFTTAGVAVGAGINFDHGSFDSANGVVFHTGTGTIFGTDDEDGSPAIFQFSTIGGFISSFASTDLDATSLEPEGIEVDPVTGNLYVVDDDLGMLFESTTSGTFVSSNDLVALTGFSDPEGLAFDDSTRTLYVSFDNDEQVAIFSVPEPAALFLAVVAALLLACTRASRR